MNKKIGFLILGMTMITSLMTAQESIIFKQSVLPNSIYKSFMQTTVGSETVFGADSTSGMGMAPMVSSGVTSMYYSVISDGLSDNKIPAVMEYDSLVSQQFVNMSETPMEMVMFKGTKIYGEFDVQGAFTLDTIVGDIDATMRSTMEQTLKQFSQAIIFPEKAMKIGDDFTQEVPFSIPLPGKEPMEMKIKTNYKLMEVKEGIAYFDLIQEYVMESKDLADMSMTGKGEGKLEFDIKNQFSIVMETESKSELMMKMGEMEISSNSTTHVKVETEFSKR